MSVSMESARAVGKVIWEGGGRLYAQAALLRRPADVYKSLAVANHVGKGGTGWAAIKSLIMPNMYAAKNLSRIQPKKSFGNWLFRTFQPRRYSSYMMLKEEGTTSALRQVVSLFLPTTSGTISATRMSHPKESAAVTQWAKNKFKISDAK